MLTRYGAFRDSSRFRRGFRRESHPHATMVPLVFRRPQFTRDALIKISGAKEKGRDFVYFTDVKNIPNTDLATIERLWLKFSNGKFGYSVQKKKWKIQSVV